MGSARAIFSCETGGILTWCLMDCRGILAGGLHKTTGWGGRDGMDGGMRWRLYVECTECAVLPVCTNPWCELSQSGRRVAKPIALEATKNSTALGIGLVERSRTSFGGCFTGRAGMFPGPEASSFSLQPASSPPPAQPTGALQMYSYITGARRHKNMSKYGPKWRQTNQPSSDREAGGVDEVWRCATPGPRPQAPRGAAHSVPAQRFAAEMGRRRRAAAT